MPRGPASPMAGIVGALGLPLPGAAPIPASDANHPRMATACGRRAVEMVWEDLKPRDVLTRGSFDNALAVFMALGGSTNAVVHLIAMAGRAGLSLTLEDIDAASRRTPMICNLKPSGQYLMEDFFYARGLRSLLTQIAPHLRLDERTVNGRTLGENIAG